MIGILEPTLIKSDLDVELVMRALSDCVIGHQIFHHDSLGSTMDEARKLAEQGAPEGTVVIAEEQTAGRGRFNREWVSPRGQNLSFSVLLRPAPAQLPSMNMAATIAVARAVTSITALKTAVKWPNDVRINGRKISGILIETAIEAGEVKHAIVGIGVNVNMDASRFPEIASLATSIFNETGSKADRTETLRLVLKNFDDLYRAVRGGGSLTQEWAAILETLGSTVQVRWLDQVVEGTAESIDDQGNLLIKRPDGSIFTAVAGEVTFQKAANHSL